MSYPCSVPCLTESTEPQSLLNDLPSVLLIDLDPYLVQQLYTLFSLWETTDEKQFFQIIAQVFSVEQALTISQITKPSLIILDLDGENGWEQGVITITQLNQICKPAKILVISQESHPKVIFEVIYAGAFGYVLKSQIPHEINIAMSHMMQNQVYLNPNHLTEVIGIFQQSLFQQFNANKSSVKLTKRERQILKLLVLGKTNEQIAKELYITIATVKAHLTGVFEKLEVKNRCQAIVKALKMQLD